MSEEQEQSDSTIERAIRAKVSRSQLLKAAGVGLVAASVPATALARSRSSVVVGGQTSFPFFPQVNGRYTTESLGTIINIAQTMEYLTTTMVNAGVTNAPAMGITGLALGSLQAALAEEVDHVNFLSAMGATPLTTTFTVPDPAILTNATTFFRTMELLETVCVAAYMTATREFAELGQPLLAKFAYQAGAVEAEHRAAARTALALMGAGASAPSVPAPPASATLAQILSGAPGDAAPPVSAPVPPNNKAFETDYFLYLADAAALLTSLGFINGAGMSVAFPGTATAMTNAGAVGASVLQPMPNNAASSINAVTVVTTLSGLGISGVVAGNGSGATATAVPTATATATVAPTATTVPTATATAGTPGATATATP